MGIGLNNADSSFFKVTSPNVPLDQAIINEDVISLTITEEAMKATSGTLLLRDKNITWSTLLRMGVKLDISWGYKDVDTNIRSILTLKENPNEIIGSMSREGFKAFVLSPSGGGDSNGYSYYSCNFIGSEYVRKGTRRVYSSGTKADVVAEVMERMGIFDWEINFTEGKDKVKEDAQIIQHESDFKFLQKRAGQWKAVFRVGYTSLGTKYAMFVDFDKFDKSFFQKKTTGTFSGDSIYANWKKGTQNVISYKWKNHCGESAQGDNIQIVVINGKTTFIRYIAENEKVVGYRFVPDKVTKELDKTKRSGGLSTMVDYMKWALNTEDFDELVNEGYFVKQSMDTPPQGHGYSCIIEMLGNPRATPPLKVKLGNGFPDNLANEKYKMFARKISHRINREGYKMTVDAVDTLTYTGGSFV